MTQYPARQPLDGEETMDPVLVGAVIVLVVVLAIFSAISLLGLVGPSQRW